tara:strand:+ start:348 stop:653 length:306 start_codon:yes stop_codon:yes gene_type:complete
MVRVNNNHGETIMKEFGFLNEILMPLIQPPKDKKIINQTARDRYQAKKLAEKLNVRLDVERDGIGWTCWVNAEEIEGNQFCTSWDEVLERLEIVEEERNNK